MDRGAWRATVHRVAKSWTQLRRLSTLPTCTERAKLWPEEQGWGRSLGRVVSAHLAMPAPQVFLGEVNSGISSTQVVVKELKASASVQEQMQFLEEAQPYRWVALGTGSAGGAGVGHCPGGRGMGPADKGKLCALQSQPPCPLAPSPPRPLAPSPPPCPECKSRVACWLPQGPAAQQPAPVPGPVC